MPPVRLVLVDDHTLLRQSLATLLGARPEVQVVGEFGNGRDAYDGIVALQPDIVLMDVAIPLLDGIEATRRLRQPCKNTRVIMLSADVDKVLLRNALRAGALGYVVKRADIDELLLAIQSVSLGNTFFSTDITQNYDVDEIRNQAVNSDDAVGLEALSGREREVLQLLVEGSTVPQIARQLTISPKTVDGHKTRIMARLGVHNRSELIRFALKYTGPGSGSAAR